jgi:hypothetical protein
MMAFLHKKVDNIIRVVMGRRIGMREEYIMQMEKWRQTIAC